MEQNETEKKLNEAVKVFTSKIVPEFLWYFSVSYYFIFLNLLPTLLLWREFKFC